MRPPLQASEIRVPSLLRRPVELRGLPVYPALFFLALFLLEDFLAVPLSLGGFTSSSDGALLSGATYRGQRLTAKRLHVSDSLPLWIAIGDARLSDQSGTVYPNSIPNWQRT